MTPTADPAPAPADRPRFFVLGHSGMLGTAVVDVIRTAGFRYDTTEERYSGHPLDPVVEAVAHSDADVVVNCAGITTHRRVTDIRLLVANALLPQHLAAVPGPRKRLLIHASTDCVFRGDRGRYRVTDPPDAVDPYGLSKRMGELAVATPGSRVVVLRTSIIGPEESTSRGLLAWYLAQRQSVVGWTDHAWNGITTLAWARLMVDIATGRQPLPPGIHQPGTNAAVSKYELLRLIGDAFDHSVEVKPVTTETPVDRTLEPTIMMPPISEQLAELARWWRGR